jgi:hypothetical protein
MQQMHGFYGTGGAQRPPKQKGPKQQAPQQQKSVKPKKKPKKGGPQQHVTFANQQQNQGMAYMKKRKIPGVNATNQLLLQDEYEDSGSILVPMAPTSKQIAKASMMTGQMMNPLQMQMSMGMFDPLGDADFSNSQPLQLPKLSPLLQQQSYQTSDSILGLQPRMNQYFTEPIQTLQAQVGTGPALLGGRNVGLSNIDVTPKSKAENFYKTKMCPHFPMVAVPQIFLIPLGEMRSRE